MNRTAPQNDLVTTEVVADHFGVTVATVRGWVRQSRIPCLRPSRRIVRFRLDEVEQALKQTAGSQSR